jgi:RNA polymerase sigma factor (TIGR02999 family)
LTDQAECSNLSPQEQNHARALFCGEFILESTLSSLIQQAESGGANSDALFSALYSELHRLAKSQLARRGQQANLSATTLLHEAYLEMAGKEGSRFPDRARFMGYAARVMRGLIIDHARSRCAQKRGGHFEITSIGVELENPADDRELSRISDALDELAKADATLAEIVDLKFFCGFTFAEIAAIKSTSERTAQRQWEKARIYLHRAISTDLEH